MTRLTHEEFEKQALSDPEVRKEYDELKSDYWLDVWVQDKLPFHQASVNPLLEKYWPSLQVIRGANILVPLCGKTSDLIFLANAGYHVIGAELSEIACEAFFVENKITFKKDKINNFTRYYSDQIEIYCGDFFQLSAAMLPSIDAVYDRAALIALPNNLRPSYAKHLTNLMNSGSQMLCIVHQSPDLVQGPPFLVPQEEIMDLYGECFQITEIARVKMATISAYLQSKGYRENDEVVYQLKRCH